MRDTEPTAVAPRQNWIVCRLCLTQPKEPMSSIFSDDETKDVTNMIKKCGGVPIKRFDHFPDKICTRCLKVLHISFRFRQTCQQAYKHLQKFVGPIEVEQKADDDSLSAAQEAPVADEEEEEEVVEGHYEQIEENMPTSNELAEAQAFADDMEESILVELEKAENVHVKSEQVEEDGIIEELYDVYDSFDGDGDIVAEGIYEQEQVQELVEHSLSGLSADIEYLEHVEQEQEQEQEQDQLTESANEDEMEETNSAEEEFLPSKPVRGLAVKRRVNTRAKAATTATITSSAPTRASVRNNPLKIKRGNSDTVSLGDSTITIGDSMMRKHGIKTKGGHKILIGDKKEFKYICDICGNMYPSQSRLTEHIKVHSGVKPHECEICGYCFAQAQQLARHMNTHTGNRPYKCSYCPAAFADLSTRNKHHRIHTNERPYECDVCHKTFTYTNTLKFHKMIHTGEKPHVCDICGKGFPQAYKLRNHRVVHQKRGSNRDSVAGLMPYDTANIVGIEM
ncbi:zinc finger protein 62 homolog [Drosophila guanche]|uniref:Blast:Zinc finger protein 16 n=1 Tax=Drosophila guanche TaxID=7266 RepID=A0A3B0KJN7_DROGU|nr:zinc finger protein 62 homolog [Drosophila guanche]SPP83968.1 blast:Zinc finger protein 16 [Drosophila guanche]